MMNRKIPVGMVIFLGLVLCAGLAYAQSLPDSGKIVVIRLNYQDGMYTPVEQYIRYGQAPNLNILSGNLYGVTVDNNGREITTFSLMEPGIAVGEGISGTPGNEGVISGYVERASSAEMVITLPYLPTLQKFNLYDATKNNLLVSIDISPAITTFCAQYAADPDCLPGASGSSKPVPETEMPVLYLSFFVVLVTSVATFAYMFFRQKTRQDIQKKLTILTVDDEPSILELLQVMLKKEGYATVSAPGGKECLEILKEKRQRPDVILLDIMMQPMDGWETLEQIKSDPRTKNIPVLMLTGKQLTAAEAKRYHIFIEDYIMKPFTNAQLIGAIEHVLARQKTIKETLPLAAKAGISKDKYCEFARLSKHVDVNKKIVHLLQRTYGVAEGGRPGDDEENKIYEQLIQNSRHYEDRFEQMKREIFSAFTEKGYPVPDW
jgi:two-component system OmpR family response regulator